MDFKELSQLITEISKFPKPMTEQEAECLRRAIKTLNNYKEYKEGDGWSKAVNNIAGKYDVSLEEAAIIINNILNRSSSEESLDNKISNKKKKTWKKNKFWE